MADPSNGWPPRQLPPHPDTNRGLYGRADGAIINYDGMAPFGAPDVRADGGIVPFGPHDATVFHGLRGRPAHALVALDGRTARAPPDARLGGSVGGPDLSYYGGPPLRPSSEIGRRP